MGLLFTAAAVLFTVILAVICWPLTLFLASIIFGAWFGGLLGVLVAIGGWVLLSQVEKL